ncbi:MAG: precorrin-6y C5,15-methyltransferase (decarboxylating) subunit CbiE [Thermodesulfobacteriota bacterium]
MIYVVGIGVEGRRGLAGRAVEVINGCGLLVAGRRHLEEFPDFKGGTMAVSAGLGAVAREIERFESGGGDVAVVATGDPLLFGMGGYILKRFGPERVEIIPGVSTVAEAFARVKESLEGAVVLSVHGGGGGKGGKGGKGGGGERDLGEVVSRIIASDKAAVFTDPGTTPASVARALLARGADGYRAYVCESLGSPDERITASTLASLVRRRRFSPLNVLVLIRDGHAPPAPPAPPARRVVAPGIPDGEFAHASGMITKSELRAVALSKLRLSGTSTVWDIGSGCGSVAVEAALAAPAGRVCAVEKEPRRVKQILENKKRFGAVNLEVIKGVAPGCLAAMKRPALPDPDAVFVGGGGAGLKDILSFAARRIKPGGRIVVNSVTMETTGSAFDFFKRRGWESEAVLVSLARAKDLGGISLLASNNPVFILTGRRPG